MKEWQERRQAIVNLVNSEGTVSFSQVKHAFPDVSEMTLRTDLKALDEEHRIVRIHGGARSIEHIVDTNDAMSAKSRRNVAEKLLICQKAVKLIRPDTSVFLDSGSTMTRLATLIPDMRVTIFTNSITVAAELARLEQARVIVPGGTLERNGLALTGARSLATVQSITFDQFFMCGSAYADRTGFTCGSDEDACLKRACMSRAGQTIALYDSSKIGGRGTFTVCPLSDIDVFVGDDKVPADFAEQCRDLGIELL